MSGTVRLYLADDRSNLAPPGFDVEPLTNQSYTLTLAFTAPQSGWTFHESLELHLPGEDAIEGYHGWHNFSRPDLVFAPGEPLHVTVVRAEWHGVLFDDWRTMQGVLWGLSLCGVLKP